MGSSKNCFFIASPYPFPLPAGRQEMERVQVVELLELPLFQFGIFFSIILEFSCHPFLYHSLKMFLAMT